MCSIVWLSGHFLYISLTIKSALYTHRSGRSSTKLSSLPFTCPNRERQGADSLPSLFRFTLVGWVPQVTRMSECRKLKHGGRIGNERPPSTQSVRFVRCYRHKELPRGHAQGKERNTISFSIIVNPGLIRVPTKDPFPIGFDPEAT
jgi:hypothetical protein